MGYFKKKIKILFVIFESIQELLTLLDERITELEGRTNPHNVLEDYLLEITETQAA